MRIKKFIIQNYKAINKLEVNLNYSINPIIGINESGKTSILQAILAFNKDRDRYNQGKHLKFQNKYDTNATKNSKITAIITLSKKELKELISHLSLTTSSKDYRVISKFTDREEFKLSRELSKHGKPYSYSNAKISKKVKKKIVDYLKDRQPFILYFDDFTDRVPEEITFNEEYAKNGELKSGGNRDWKEIIEEIFKLNDSMEHEKDTKALQKYMNIVEQDTKNDILSDIEDVLNREIIEEWKKVKKSGLTNFADDSDQLTLVLDNSDKNTFRFKVRDKSFKDKKRTFNINERSKGFQWFFNYMIKLKFNPKYKIESTSLFLLDEPGSYLHSSAQGELLKELKRVSKKNIIIFCTHSQFLLNPLIIRLGSIKITEKARSKISLSDFGSYKAKRDMGALSPVIQALRINFSNEFLGKVVITEGATDFYLLELLRKYAKKIPEKIKIIPGSGAGSSTTLISLALPFSDNFLLLFDNDDAGKKAADKYALEFEESIRNHFHFYHKSEKKYLLENHLVTSDKVKLKKLTKTKDIKKALAILFYDISAEDTRDFIDNLDKETIENFQDTFAVINKL